MVVVVFDLWCGVGGHFANTKDEGPNFWAADARLGARAGGFASPPSGWAYMAFHIHFCAKSWYIIHYYCYYCHYNHYMPIHPSHDS